MFESFFVITYFCILVAIQSIIGVGVLVLGTPFLLILNYNIVDILFALLPLSILTSLINLIIIKISNNFKLENNLVLKNFFLICLPSIFIGLLILKVFQEYINFKVIVGIVILFSIFLVNIKTKIKFKINFFRKSILALTGIIHGLTNSGGTLMSLIVSSDTSKENARLQITFFYLVLALSQYFLTILIFQQQIYNPFNIFSCLFLLIGIVIGNILINIISKNFYKQAVNLLAIITSIILFINH